MKYELIIYLCDKANNTILSSRSFVRDTAKEILELINNFSETTKYFINSFIRFEIKEVK